jgi:glycosyltransferase involved in cell wall biosynthesis
MDYQPNADAALFLVQKILPLLREMLPDVELIIAGRNPRAELTEIARQDSKITVTGFVEDLRPYLERAMVYVAPVHVASGMQNKVLEALAMQVPVVTTPVVSDGLRVDEGIDPPVRVADSPEAFAQQTVHLLKSSNDRELLMEQGRRYVENHFNWQRSAKILEEMCEAAVEKRN